MEYIQLSLWDVALASSLILGNALISLALRLGLERSLLFAAARAVVQLLAIGFVLGWVMRTDSAIAVLGIMALMTLIAGFAAVRRTQRRFRGIWISSIVSVWASAWLVSGFALEAVIKVDPWYRAQYSIPLLGMVLGNTLSGISLGLERMMEELVIKRDQVETLLALGATRWEAARLPIREAIRTGMIPMMNMMTIVGLVSLPGMMTGQLLAGVDPLQAVRYQIVILFVIASATALGTVSIVLLTYRRVFNADHQFLAARLTRR